MDPVLGSPFWENDVGPLLVVLVFGLSPHQPHPPVLLVHLHLLNLLVPLRLVVLFVCTTALVCVALEHSIVATFL